MSASIIGAAAIARLAAPLVKDIYDGSKGGVKKSLARWAQAKFPQRLAKRLIEIDSVKTIWSSEESVSLRKFYYPSHVSTYDGLIRKIDLLSDLPGGNLVVQGIVGQGKSILLRYLALQEIVQADFLRLPVFFGTPKGDEEYSINSIDI